MIRVDTNVLVDLVTDDPLWGEWSQRQLDRAAAQDELAINDIVYAELSVGYSRIEELDAMIREVGLVTVGGLRTGVLPDFFLGAHAAISDSVLIYARCRSPSNLFSRDHADRA